MDTNTLMKTLLSNESVKGLVKKSGASQEQVESIIKNALPMLLDGAKKQANGESTSKGFANALLEHADSDTTDLSAFMDGIDLADGAKIIGHLLGAEKGSATKSVAKKSGADNAKTETVLSMAAPLLMSLLGKETKNEHKKKDKKKKEEAAGGLMGTLLQNVDVGELAGSLLGGGKDDKKDDGLDLGDIASLFGSLLK